MDQQRSTLKKWIRKLSATKKAT